MVRNIRLALDDEDAEALDEIRERNNTTWREMLLLSITPKKKKKGLTTNDKQT